MTLFIKLENGVPTGHPILESNFRMLFKNVSFPKYFTAESVEPHGYGIWDYGSKPEMTRYQKAVETTPVREDVGIWRQTWEVVDMSDEERTEVDERKANEMRINRHILLNDTDYWMHSDTAEATDEQLAYRQALRDITTHSNWPHLSEDDWPTKP